MVFIKLWVSCPCNDCNVHELSSNSERTSKLGKQFGVSELRIDIGISQLPMRFSVGPFNEVR